MPVVGTAAARPGHAMSVVTEWSVDPDDWGEFLCRTFDFWLENGFGRALVNWFESLVGQWVQRPAQMCTLAEVCGRSLAIEHDRIVYSCDHFVYPEYRFGCLDGKGPQLADLAYSPRQCKFGCEKRDALPDYCKKCSYRSACNGECPRTASSRPRTANRDSTTSARALVAFRPCRSFSPPDRAIAMVPLPPLTVRLAGQATRPTAGRHALAFCLPGPPPLTDDRSPRRRAEQRKVVILEPEPERITSVSHRLSQASTFVPSRPAGRSSRSCRSSRLIRRSCWRAERGRTPVWGFVPIRAVRMPGARAA